MAPRPVIDSTVADEAPPVSEDAREVKLLGVDLRSTPSLSRQYYELRRELRLLAVAHQDHYPLAADLSAMFTSFERQIPGDLNGPSAPPRRTGARAVDVSLRMEPEASADRLHDDRDVRPGRRLLPAERLLSLQRTPDQRTFHLWYLGEMVRQLAGEAPLSWHSDGGHHSHVGTSYAG